MDPTADNRQPSPARAQAAAAFMAARFPGLAGAPLLETRVCAYENTPDGHLLVDRHPGATNVWLLGGGSGHGFKHGPAVGEHAAACILGAAPVEPLFSMARYGRNGTGAGIP